jgi:hypothetical protein
VLLANPTQTMKRRHKRQCKDALQLRGDQRGHEKIRVVEIVVIPAADRAE